MKTQIHDLRKVRMWYEVKELSSNPGNSDSKIAKKLGIDRRTVSRYKKMSEEEFHVYINIKVVLRQIWCRLS